MKILVTGASGFLGSILCPILIESGHEVIALSSKDCDLSKRSELSRIPDLKFDQIYHLAVYTQAGDWCKHHQGEQWLVNQYINTNVLDYWHHRQPQAKLIATGSSCVYDPRLELKEENYLNGTPIASLFGYAMTKKMLFAGIKSLHRQFGHKWLFVIPSTLYGAGYQPKEGKQYHFIFDLIRKILRGKHLGEPVVLWGDGYQKRELTPVRDFARITIELAARVDNEILNIGTGVEYSMRDYAQEICKVVGYDPDKIEYDTTRYVGARSKCVRVDKLRKLLGEVSFTPLEDGITDTTNYLAQTILQQALQG